MPSHQDAKGAPSHPLLGLVGWMAVSFMAATAGALASAQAMAFYQGLLRPAWAPPGWLFPPVWTVLYTLMGLSAWLVWRRAGFRAARTGLLLFLVQLVVNALWSWLFFVWHLGAAAFTEILVLWCLIAATMSAFYRRRALAAFLLAPYLVWVTFAAVLAHVTWRLNPARL